MCVFSLNFSQHYQAFELPLPFQSHSIFVSVALHVCGYNWMHAHMNAIAFAFDYASSHQNCLLSTHFK